GAVHLEAEHARRDPARRWFAVLVQAVAALPAAPEESATRMERRSVQRRRHAVRADITGDVLALLGHAIAIGIRVAPDARRLGYIKSALVPDYAVRNHQPVGEDRG